MKKNVFNWLGVIVITAVIALGIRVLRQSVRQSGNGRCGRWGVVRCTLFAAHW